MQRPGTRTEKLQVADLLREVRLTNDMTPPAQDTDSAPMELEDDEYSQSESELLVELFDCELL